jgi:hypothetical protein
MGLYRYTAKDGTSPCKWCCFNNSLHYSERFGGWFVHCFEKGNFPGNSCVKMDFPVMEEFESNWRDFVNEEPYYGD